MFQRFLKFILIVSIIATPIKAWCEDDDPPDPIILYKGKGNGKQLPPKYPVCLFYSYPEACLSTSMPYSCAIIDVADEDGNVYSSMMATPDESCGLLDLQPSSTITVTFDNGTILQGKYSILF